MLKDDQELKQDIEAELSWDPKVTATQIGVTVDRGAVSLFGTVETYAQKWAAEAAVRRVRGVRAFAEELSVKPTAPHQRTDLELTTSVARALAEHANVPDSVVAKVEQGWVTLYGEVSEQFQRQMAVALVGHLDGVLGVTNQISIGRKRIVSVGEGGISAALKRRFGTAAEGITVSVEGTRVTLSGKVPTLRAAREARDAAWAAPGVTEVVDALETETLP